MILIASGFILLAGCNNEANEEIEEVQEENDTEAEEEVEEVEKETEPPKDNEGELEETFTVPDPVVIEEELWDFDQGEAYDLVTEVGPIVVEGDYAILPVLVDSDHEAEPFFRDIFFGGYEEEDQVSNFDVRLIDGEERSASHVAILNYESDHRDGLSRKALETFLGEGSLNNRMTMGPDHQPVRYFAVFEAPVSEQVHILFRSIGMAENVPVINREEAEITSLAEVEEDYESVGKTVEERFHQGVPTVEEIVERELNRSQFEEMTETYSDNIQTRTMSLETYQEGLDTSVSKIEEIEYATLLLSGDVLFDFDSADLTSEADRELEVSAIELEGAEGGELKIVGHTDNVNTEEYNQELSEDRAQAVHDRLDEVTDLTPFDEITIGGESFREPIADNDTEEGRAQNRRVEIQFTPPAEVIEREIESAELPEALGVEVEFPNAAPTEHGVVEILSLRQVDDLFVGRIKVQTYEDELESNALLAYGSGATALSGARGWHYKDAVGFSGLTIYNITLLHEGQRYYPVDYYMEPLSESVGEERLENAEDEDVEFILPLAERFLPRSTELSNDEAAYYTATVVWPAVSTDEVVIELGLPSIQTVSTDDIDMEVDSVQPWRITNVPLEIGSND
ncbi:OmpA family protein [Salipaludibacillus sp. HK11]|uniref:OmpA family protein n=1 Tax=Salipaludibacillus sp. HK11 TaxID=3394320 RepID=UPI0039FCDE4E